MRSSRRSSSEPSQSHLTVDEQSASWICWNKLNRRYLQKVGDQPQLEGAIQSLESAFRLQTEAAEAVRHPQGTRKDPRPLRHLRFRTRLPDGAASGRERRAHGADLLSATSSPGTTTMTFACTPSWRAEDGRAVAALIDDLKARGLFDETLVVIAGEFGRTPMIQNSRV